VLLLNYTNVMFRYDVFQPEAGKKRAAKNALKTPLSDKKAKVACHTISPEDRSVVKYLQSSAFFAMSWNCC
jgi:hypothetical protein